MNDSKIFNYDLLQNKNFPNFKKPLLCGYFSIGKERNLQLDASNLLYFNDQSLFELKKKSVNLDLAKGSFQTYKRPEFLKEDEKINHMLEYLKYNSQKHLSNDDNKLFQFDFICFRGLLTTILCTPYEKKENWSISVSYFKGNIYLHDIITDEKRNNILQASEKQKKCASWGYKFEQYLLSGNPNIKPNSSKPVIETEEFCGMFSTKLNNKQLMYGAEMDGLISSEIVNIDTENNLNFIELKTTRMIDNSRQEQNLIRYKYIKWWCQCFMVGIENIAVGFRNDYGRVLELKLLNVKELSKSAKGIWDPNVCMNFLDEFLSYIKDIVTNDKTINHNDPFTVWQFYWRPQHQIKITYEKFVGRSKYSFLPDWFIEHVNSIRK